MRIGKQKLHRRKKFFVNRALQGRLIARLCVYWFVCQFFAWHVLFCLHRISSTGFPTSPTEDYSDFLIKNLVVFASALVFLPIIVWDFTKFTNRVAGPLMLIEQALKDMTAGKHVAPLKLRGSDMLSDTAEALNRFVDSWHSNPKSPELGNDALKRSH